MARKPRPRTEAVKAQQRRYKKAHPEITRTSHRKWYQAHKEEAKIKVKAWRLNNPDKLKAIRYRAAIKEKANRAAKTAAKKIHLNLIDKLLAE
jgi:hypothetical protein